MNNILDQNLILKGKKVLLRVDLNVPIKNGAITESSRIEKIIPTITHTPINNIITNSISLIIKFFFFILSTLAAY